MPLSLHILIWFPASIFTISIHNRTIMFWRCCMWQMGSFIRASNGLSDVVCLSHGRGQCILRQLLPTKCIIYSWNTVCSSSHVEDECKVHRTDPKRESKCMNQSWGNDAEIPLWADIMPPWRCIARKLYSITLQPNHLSSSGDQKCTE